jgi:hypothetical protein
MGRVGQTHSLVRKGEILGFSNFAEVGINA